MLFTSMTRTLLALAAFASGAAVFAADPAASAPPDLLRVVRGYADAMIDRSRAHLPEPRTPLFPIVLTRDTLELTTGKVQNLHTARVPQEFKDIANPHH